LIFALACLLHYQNANRKRRFPLKQASVLENPFCSAAISQEYSVKSPCTIRNALAMALWNEPEDMATIKQRMCMESTGEESGCGPTDIAGKGIERELIKLISAGLVGTRYGYYFLTVNGRFWAERIRRFDNCQVITG
jgi:hypothetical protein